MEKQVKGRQETQRHKDTKTQRHGVISQLAGLGQAVSSVYKSQQQNRCNPSRVGRVCVGVCVPEHQVLMLLKDRGGVSSSVHTSQSWVQLPPSLVWFSSVQPSPGLPNQRHVSASPPHHTGFLILPTFPHIGEEKSSDAQN